MEIRPSVARFLSFVAAVLMLPGSASAQVQLSVSPSTINVQGSAGTPLPSQTLDISNSGNQSLKWSVESTASWVSVSPTSGVQRGSVTVSFPSSSSLPSGTYHTSLTVSDSDG